MSRHVAAATPIVLLYVSVAERYARILTSRSVREKIPDEHWNAVIQELTTTIQSEGLRGACIKAIRHATNLLVLHFPENGETHMHGHHVIQTGGPMKKEIASTEPSTQNQHEHLCLPWLWPICALQMAQSDPLCEMGEHFIQNEMHFTSDFLKFAEEAHKLDYELKPVWATPNTIKLDLKTMRLRDFSEGSTKGLPVIIDAPYAGHSATIADYSPDQSLVRALKANGLERVYVTDWKSATDAMKDFSIDTYLEDLNTAVDAMGGKAHLIGLCQGGWMSAAYAARFPGKVRTLVLAGSPIDTDAGEGAVKDLAHTLPMVSTASWSRPEAADFWVNSCWQDGKA